MKPEPSRAQDVQQRNRLILWIDDDSEMIRRISHLLERRGRPVDIHPVEELGEFEAIASHLTTTNPDVPLVVFMLARRIPEVGRLRDALDRTPICGVISDLQMGGDVFAGLTMLSAAASSRSRPNLALVSSSIDPSIERLATGIGATCINKRDDEGLHRMLDDWLDLRSYESSRRVLRMEREIVELRSQNLRLQREKRALKKQVTGASASGGSSTKPKMDTKEKQPSNAELEKANHLTQMVLAHNHDLANTSSLALKTLEHLCTDLNLIPPVLLVDLQRARIAAKHCDILVQSLASISGNERRGRSEPASVEHAVRDVSEILRRKFPETITLEIKVAERLPLCSIPAHLLVRILLNLLLNALEAMPKGGKIIVSVERCAGKGKPIILQVRDSGIGIKKSDIPKVCGHDFSTKGKRNGFGLFIVQRIMADFSGTLSLSSTRGKGTKVTLGLPTI